MTIKGYILDFIKARYHLEDKKNFNTTFTSNINVNFASDQKHVLISYLDFIESGKQISDEMNFPGSLHTNRYELFQIIYSFIQLGFCIDVCACYDTDIENKIDYGKYDLVFGFGNVFRKAIEESSAYKILYMTENPYYVSFRREKERIDYFEERHHKRVPITRSGMFYHENDEKKADAIICLGESVWLEDTGKTIQRIYPSAFTNEEFADFNNRKKTNFLVFGATGLVHKGIDLLVDVFTKHREWSLYICGDDVNPALKELGYGKIPNNIHDCGYIRVGSQEFVDLVKICSFIVLPSCSEACTTGILTGMCYGLIPIVMHGNGFDDFAEYCEFFPGYSIDDIENKIKAVILYPEDEIYRKYKEISEFANSMFSLKRFSERFDKALRNILGREMFWE